MGQVNAPSSPVVMNMATYECGTGYDLDGSMIRMCGADGNWTPSEPTCERKHFIG